MECGCEIDINEGCNLPKFDIREESPVARKEHVCCECGRTIRKGERYLRESCIWEETGPATMKTCTDCESVRDKYFCGHSYGLVWGQLRDKIEEEIWETKGGNSFVDSRLAELTPAAREKVCALIEDAWKKFEGELPGFCRGCGRDAKHLGLDPNGLCPYCRGVVS